MIDIEPKQFEKCPNYHRYELSEEQIELIAEKASDKAAIKAVELARNGFYKDVGETVVSKFLWAIGLIVVGLFVWLQTHNIIKL